MKSESLKLITEAIQNAVKPNYAMRVKGKVLFVKLNDILYVTQLFLDRGNTREHSLITADIGILSLPLAMKLSEMPSEYYPKNAENNPTISACHWNWRIGNLMPERIDTWWDISTAEQTEAAAAEISQAVAQYGLPRAMSIRSTADLVALWESGNCPGLSDFQRKKYLGYLPEFTIGKPGLPEPQPKPIPLTPKMNSGKPGLGDLITNAIGVGAPR
jgi:hypothetical protein